MADYGSIFGGLGGAVSDIFAASGYKKAAKAYDKAASFSRQSAGLEEISTSIRQFQADRDIYRTLGGQRADVAGAGLASSGTALDLLRDSAFEGAMTKSLTGIQGEVNVLGQQAQATAYAGQASSMRAQAGGGLLGGIMKAVGVGASLIAMSDRRVKKDIVPLGVLSNGLAYYEFEYVWGGGRRRGVMADEVEKVLPEAISRHPAGYAMVDYSMIPEIPGA